MVFLAFEIYFTEVQKNIVHKPDNSTFLKKKVLDRQIWYCFIFLYKNSTWRSGSSIFKSCRDIQKKSRALLCGTIVESYDFPKHSSYLMLLINNKKMLYIKSFCRCSIKYISTTINQTSIGYSEKNLKLAYFLTPQIPTYYHAT